MTEMTRCMHTRASGVPCQGATVGGTDFCWTHQPDRIKPTPVARHGRVTIIMGRELERARVVAWLNEPARWGMTPKELADAIMRGLHMS